MNRWIETGFLTHGEANVARCQLLEDYPLNEGEEFEIDCYAIGQGQYKYGVKIVQKDDAK